ncbi:MAG TPA: ATP-binding protein [Nocardioidaceae bacterium]|nr:ATP-binding protein [Nocardioidaceae bacterium]
MDAVETLPSTVCVAIARDPALVRTVRLVAAAVARRTGQDEEFVEEVRLAVGEACALMVSDGSEAGVVAVRMGIADRLYVEVASDTTVDVEDPATADLDGVEPLALLRGLIDDVTVVQDAGTTVGMSWPLS